MASISSPSNRPLPARSRSADGGVIVTLIAASVVIAWPVFLSGYMTYLDNPAHLAEVYALAFEAGNGWSDIGYCGFPLGALHSPLWYGSLVWLVRLGIPGAAVYSAAVWLGFIAPPLALYVVTRRRLGARMAGTLAFLLMIQRPAVVGIGSALGGMWTFYVAAAVWLLWLDRLDREDRGWRRVTWIALLTALATASHLFVAVPMVIAGGAYVLSRRRARRTLWLNAAGILLGLGASCAYWLRFALVCGLHPVPTPDLTPKMLLARLFLPTYVPSLHQGYVSPLTPMMLLEAMPMIALIALGLAAIGVSRKRDDALPHYGRVIAGSLMVILLALPALEHRVDLPVSWRYVYYIRIGMALSAVPLLASVSRRLPRALGRMTFTAAALVLAVALGVAAPLRKVTAPLDGAEMGNVRALWNWLAENREPQWGRIFMQDTFQTRPLDQTLRFSHVLAMTSRETGVRQLGAYYGVVPFSATAWTRGEFGTVYSRRVDTDSRRRAVVELMEESNTTHLVLSDPAMATQLQMLPDFEEIYRTGRFVVLHRANAVSNWVVPARGDVEVEATHYDSGKIDVKTAATTAANALQVRVAYNRYWHGRGVPGLALSKGEHGLLRVDGVPAGAHEIQLAFEAPMLPSWLSLIASILIVLAGIASMRVRRSSLRPPNA